MWRYQSKFAYRVNHRIKIGSEFEFEPLDSFSMSHTVWLCPSNIEHVIGTVECVILNAAYDILIMAHVKWSSLSKSLYGIQYVIKISDISYIISCLKGNFKNQEWNQMKYISDSKIDGKICIARVFFWLIRVLRPLSSRRIEALSTLYCMIHAVWSMQWFELVLWQL